jgi:hypothetical protein
MTDCAQSPFTLSRVQFEKWNDVRKPPQLVDVVSGPLPNRCAHPAPAPAAMFQGLNPITPALAHSSWCMQSAHWCLCGPVTLRLVQEVAAAPLTLQGCCRILCCQPIYAEAAAVLLPARARLLCLHSFLHSINLQVYQLLPGQQKCCHVTRHSPSRDAPHPRQLPRASEQACGRRTASQLRGS